MTLNSALQAIVQKYADKQDCTREDTCRCKSCKETLASYPSRKKAREASSFTKFAFPLVRRVFNPALAPSLVSIQPMTVPHSGVFYLNYTYGDQSDPEEDDKK
jgi:hypothetical protein